MAYYGYSWRPYVSAAARKNKAAKTIADLRKKGHAASPVVVVGRQIASSFWGRAWCDHLESFSDYENRLPRGRTYVRNGSVIDLQILPGELKAMVSGSDIYKIKVGIKPVEKRRWSAIVETCGGRVDSVVSLLAGRLSDSVIEALVERDAGLFPAPDEITLSCSCPDWASMCKHVAAVLYGVGNRLDAEPELLFTLRQVDKMDLIGRGAAALADRAMSGTATIAGADLSSLFGIEMEGEPAAEPHDLGEILATLEFEREVRDAFARAFADKPRTAQLALRRSTS